MTIEQVVQYVLHTPFNTNRAILTSMLEQLIIDHGGSLDGSIPDDPDRDVIYDGGVEN